MVDGGTTGTGRKRIRAVKTTIPSRRHGPLQKKLLEAIDGIKTLVEERNEAIEAMEKARQWDERPHARASCGLPAPRIQFEHVPSVDGWGVSWCIYWMVLPLRPHDIRREGEDGVAVYDEWFVPMGQTMKRGASQPPVHNGKVQTPFRDGAHARFDMETLGVVIPIYATCQGVNTLIENPKQS